MTALFFSRSNNAVEDDDGEDYLKGLDVDDRGGRGVGESGGDDGRGSGGGKSNFSVEPKL